MKHFVSLIFSNKTWLQTILKNTFWVSLSEGIIRLTRAGIVVLMARILGPDGYGSFAFAFATVSMFTFIFDAGIASTITRDFAKDARNEKLFPEILSLKLCLALIGISAISISSIFISDDGSVRTIMVILGLYFIVMDFETGLFSFFRARQRMEYEALIRVFVSAGLIIATVIVLWSAASPLNIAYVFLGTACSSLFITYFVRRKIVGGQLTIRANPGIWLKFLKSSLPLGITGATASLYFSLDSTMLGIVGTLRDTGLYSAVNRIAYFLVLPGTVISSVLIPALSTSTNSGSSLVVRRVNLWVTLNLALGALVIAFIWAESENIVLFLYGNEFLESARPLRWLAITTMLIYVYYPWYTVLIVYEKQNRLLIATVMGLIVNVVLTLTLIPAFGITGAAISTIGTHSAVMIGFAIFTGRGTPIVPINSVWVSSAVSSAAAGIAAYAVTALLSSNIWASIPVCVITFAVIFLAVGKLLGLDTRLKSTEGG